MSFGVFNIDMTLQIRSKILFEESFGDALRINKDEEYLYFNDLDICREKVKET